jgi:hypothetical protein
VYGRQPSSSSRCLLAPKQIPPETAPNRNSISFPSHFHVVLVKPRPAPIRTAKAVDGRVVSSNAVPINPFSESQAATELRFHQYHSPFRPKMSTLSLTDRCTDSRGLLRDVRTVPDPLFTELAFIPSDRLPVAPRVFLQHSRYPGRHSPSSNTLIGNDIKMHDAIIELLYSSSDSLLSLQFSHPNRNRQFIFVTIPVSTLSRHNQAMSASSRSTYARTTDELTSCVIE